MGRKSFTEIGVLGLYTETPLHCGAESGAGYVDLPVQRERHTDYPVIPGSTLKGVLHDELRGKLSDLDALFGTPDAKTPGTVSFGDGIVVAFPVRSSGAPFHWVTCPFVLERAFRALGRPRKVDPPPAKAGWAAGDQEVLLDEVRLEKRPHADLAQWAADLLDLLPDEAKGFAYTRKLFPDHLVVVSDEDFKELIQVGTEVVTRIKLNYLGTTVNLDSKEHPDDKKSEDLQGNMFVEEVVPPETLFLCPLRALEEPSQLVDALPPVVRIGGDESIGRGVTHLKYLAARS